MFPVAMYFKDLLLSYVYLHRTQKQSGICPRVPPREASFTQGSHLQQCGMPPLAEIFTIQFFEHTSIMIT